MRLEVYLWSHFLNAAEGLLFKTDKVQIGLGLWPRFSNAAIGPTQSNATVNTKNAAIELSYSCVLKNTTIGS